MVGVSVMTAQTKSVSGTVVSAEDGESVIGASVLIKGTAQGTISDMDGKFTIDVPSNNTLVVSYIGMRTIEVQAQDGMVVKLEVDSKQLEEVVVTAMGISRSQKSLGYAATVVKGDEVAEARNSNVMTNLQGKVAGLQVQSVSSTPGGSNSVVIRGFSSINGNNQPLYIIDGVPLASNDLEMPAAQTTIGVGGINNIPAENIAEMTVLKGAAATALYGSRAANGVIVITTKSGAKGEGGKNFTIAYNGGLQVRQVSVLPTMQNTFGLGWNGANTVIENGSWGPEFDGSMQTYGPIWNNSQLLREYTAVEHNVLDFFDLGVSHNHNISLSGASSDNKMTYYMAYSNASEDGIMPTDNDTYARNTINFNSSYAPEKWIKVSSAMNFATSKTSVVSSFQGTSVIDGLYELPRGISLVDKQDLTSAFNTPEAYFTPYGITNPYWALENNYNTTNSKQVYGKMQVDIKPIEQVTLMYRFGFDYSDYDNKQGTPEIALDDALINNNFGYPPSSMNQAGNVYTGYRRSYETNHDVLANYSDIFGDFDLSLNVGMNVNERGYTSMSGQTSGLTFETGFWDLSNGASKDLLTESQMKRRAVGLFGDLTLGWKNQLFLNATARNDWSSTLPQGSNSFFYPGATLSWIFTELLPKNDVFTFGKARVAYGMTGNDANPYLTTANYIQGYANGYYGADIALFPMNGTNAFIMGGTVGSSSLRPEITSEFEVGVNLQFFNGRIGLDAAYYDRTTDDQIFTLPVDAASGYRYAVTNFGAVNNKGVELLLTTTPVQTKKIKWDVDFNFSKNWNEVVSLPESLEGGRVILNSFSAGDDAVYMYAEVGQPMGVLYTYLPQYVEEGEHAGKQIVDSSGLPTKGEAVENTGWNVNHDWTGGVSTSLSAYGFTLGASLDVRMGGYMFSRTKNLMQFTGNGIHTTYNERRPFVMPNTVQADGAGGYVVNETVVSQIGGTYQQYYDTHGFGNAGKAYLLDRSFAKIRNITLGYSLPKSVLKPARLSDVTLSLFVNNPFVWTAADNTFIDPETSTEGSDLEGAFGEMYANPSCRIWGCNLSVKF